MALSLRLESILMLGLNPKLRHSLCSIPNLHGNAHSLAAFSHNHGGEEEPEIEEKDNRFGTQESLKQALETFREQASKIRGASEEAYELYSKKASLILKDATEKLSQEANQYLDNSPEVKEIVETFTSPNRDLNRISQVQGFHVGIPYGLVLSLGGFVSFMVTGSIAALRFGIVLGGVLLALSISSLRSYRRGQPSPLMLKAQAAIASILFLREIRLLAAEVRQLYFILFRCLYIIFKFIIGAVVAFYVYRLVLERKQQNVTNLKSGAEN